MPYKITYIDLQTGCKVTAGFASIRLRDHFVKMAKDIGFLDLSSVEYFQ